MLTKVCVTAVEGHALPKDASAAFRAILERDPKKPLRIAIEESKAPVDLACRADAEMPPFQKLLK